MKIQILKIKLLAIQILKTIFRGPHLKNLYIVEKTKKISCRSK